MAAYSRKKNERRQAAIRLRVRVKPRYWRATGARKVSCTYAYRGNAVRFAHECTMANAAGCSSSPRPPFDPRGGRVTGHLVRCLRGSNRLVSAISGEDGPITAEQRAYIYVQRGSQPLATNKQKKKMGTFRVGASCKFTGVSRGRKTFISTHTNRELLHTTLKLRLG